MAKTKVVKIKEGTVEYYEAIAEIEKSLADNQELFFSTYIPSKMDIDSSHPGSVEKIESWIDSYSGYYRYIFYWISDWDGDEVYDDLYVITRR
ncbi:MAG: hypothetical protein FWE25_03385 [Lachnospiraceae bacterium]|nr:hypothetical protein [Lachnospiraceae bacterium]